MATIQELMLRAQLLKQETALDSISPERAGGIMYDTLQYINQMQLQAANPLLISKIYASVAAMEADTAPVSDLTGQALRPGQVVVIASSDSDNGSVYRYNGGTESRWTVVGKIGNLTPVDSLDSDSTQLPLAAHQGKVLDGKITALGQKVDDINENLGMEVQFVSGAINYLNGNEIADGKAIRSGFITALNDVEIYFSSDRVVSAAYFVKYLGGVYAGYEVINPINDTSFSYTLTKDNTFDSFRIRVSVNSSYADWSSSDIASAKAEIRLTTSIAKDIAKINETLGGLTAYDENCSFWEKRYANLSGIAVGSVWVPVYTGTSNYACCVARCFPGDIFDIATAGNTAGAKAYAFLDGDLKCISFQQAAIVGELTAPDGAAYLVVNSRTNPADTYSLKKLSGEFSRYGETKRRPYYFDDFYFDSGNLNYLTGAPGYDDGSAIITGLIPVSSDVVLKVRTPRSPAHLLMYVIRYLNGVYVDYLLYQHSSAVLPQLLKKDTTFNGIAIKLGVDDGISWTAEQTRDTLMTLYSPQQFRDIFGDIVDYRRYGIGNYDNAFQFDELTAAKAEMLMLRLVPNFNMPTDGAFLSTDIDYTGVRTAPISDLQLTRANVPYLYINGEKRGTIVLYDTDGTPFIYDIDGNKRILNIS